MDAKVVIDASVWVSRLILQEDHHEASDYWTRGFFAAGGKLVAPALLLLEVAAAMSRATRDASFAQEAVENLKNLEGAFFVPIDTFIILEAIDIACNLHLRAGDAMYVAVAHQLDIPLVSWDKEQMERSKNLITTYTPDNYPW